MSDERDTHLRLASSRPMAVLPGGLADSGDPAEEPLPAGTPRPALTSISVRRSGRRVSATAALALTGQVLTGHASREDSDRALAIAQATLDAVRPLLEHAAEVESAQVVTVPGREVALTVLNLSAGSLPGRVLVGSALIRGDLEDALARSVLSALNRRLKS